MTEVLLKDLRYEGGDLIHKWDFVDLGPWKRVYYKLQNWESLGPPSGQIGDGFYFCAINIMSHIEDRDPWDIDSTSVEVIYWGNGLFDGIRHMYMGSEQTDNYGYDYYPTIDDHILFLKTIRELELKYCRDADEYK